MMEKYTEEAEKKRGIFLFQVWPASIYLLPTSCINLNFPAV
jgi:hypothetical protein